MNDETETGTPVAAPPLPDHELLALASEVVAEARRVTAGLSAEDARRVVDKACERLTAPE